MTNSSLCYCSFCGRTQYECEFLLAGPVAAFICNECVSDAVETVARKRVEKKLAAETARCGGCQPTRLELRGYI